MLQMSPAQLKRLEGAAWDRFVGDMVRHAQDFAPTLSAVLGPDTLRGALQQNLERGLASGFTHRGPLRLWVELSLLFGSGFDTDPQCPMVSRALAEPGDEMQRAERVHQVVNHYLAEVMGPDNAHVRLALQTLQQLCRSGELQTHLHQPGTDVAAVLPGWMMRIFPRKAHFLGAQALQQLSHQGVAHAARWGLTDSLSQGTLITLMFSFGHACTNDPLYPWISRTLNRPHPVSPEEAALRLQRKALTWLDHVLARTPGQASR